MQNYQRLFILTRSEGNKKGKATKRITIKKHHLDSAIVTIFVFAVISLFALIPISLGFLDPIGTAVKDFDIYDIVFSKFRSEQSVDTNIVLVNIGNLDRRDIAGELNIINRYKPKVIGLDAFFWKKKDKAQDSILSKAIENTPNLVLASRLDFYNNESDRYDSLMTSNEIAIPVSFSGFANLPDEESGGYRTIRSFKAFANYKSQTEHAFAVRVLELADKKYVERLTERNNDRELINYRGNFNKFYYLDADDFFNKHIDMSFIKNKIVLMGYMGVTLNTLTFEDIFFTPLNERYAGRTFPDMYGVVINANIISMVMNNSFINKMSYWVSVLLAILLCFISIRILLAIKKIYKDWFGAVFKLFIFTMMLINLVVGVYIFNQYNYKINLTLTLIAIVLSPTCLDLYLLFIEKKIFRVKKMV